MDPVFLSSLNSIFRMLLIALIGYVAVVMLLRLTGKRSLSKFNSFDFVVTIALGSILASMLTTKSVALAQGVGAIAVLLFLQGLTTFAASRWQWFDEIVKADPTLLVRNGDIIDSAIRKCRVSQNEIYAAARDSSVGDLKRVAAMVLESDGTISVISTDQAGDLSAVPDED